MPIYEYVCGACNQRHDILQKISDQPLKICPTCGEARLEKLISAPSFRLAGSGWYETDFKTKNQRNIAGERDPAKSKADKTDKKSGQAEKSAKSDKAAPKTAAVKAKNEA